MTTIQIILMLLTIVIECPMTAVYLHLQRPGKSWKSRTAKMICSTMFLLQALICIWANGGLTTQFALYMLIGLGLAWLGDFFIHFNGAPMFVLGGLFFMAAHILYICAYTSYSGVFLTIPLVVAIVVILGAVLAFMLLQKLKLPMKIAWAGVLVYGLIISTMVAKAWFCALQSGSVGLCLTLCGGSLLFLLSDSSLILNMMHEKFKTDKCKDFNIWTYYLGQTLLAISILFV